MEPLAVLGKPWFAVPGNHDLARLADTWGQPDPEAVEAWERWAGPLQWTRDTESSRIVGLNYLDWSTENRAWLTAQLDTSKRKVVIQHFPLTGVVTGGYWLDIHAAEKLAFLQATGVSLVLTGHRHQFSVSRFGGMTHIVLPAISYIAGDGPDALSNAIFPFSLPTRGWLEIVDGDALTVELYRQDGQVIWSYTPQTIWLPQVVR